MNPNLNTNLLIFFRTLDDRWRSVHYNWKFEHKSKERTGGRSYFERYHFDFSVRHINY